MNKLLLAFIFILLNAGTVCAQISLEECYVLAKNNYPQIKKADLITKTKDYSITNVGVKELSLTFEFQHYLCFENQ